MNHLVFLNAQAGELEKILSGVKTMLVKEFDPSHTPRYPVNPGDHLYFLRDKDEGALRVKATVVRVQFLLNSSNKDLARTLKEKQSRLQFTEDQFNFWSVKRKVLCIEFDSAQKVPVINIAPDQIKNITDWIAFEDFDSIKGRQVVPDLRTIHPGGKQGVSHVRQEGVE